MSVMTETATFPQPVRAPEIFLTELARVMTILNNPEYTHYSLHRDRDELQEALDKGVYPRTDDLYSIVFFLRDAKFALRRKNNASTPEEREIQSLIDSAKLLHEQAEINNPPDYVLSTTSAGTGRSWIVEGLLPLALVISIILGKTLSPGIPCGFMLLCVDALYLFGIKF